MADKYDALAKLLPAAQGKALASATRLKATPDELRAALMPYFAPVEKQYGLPKNLLVNMAQKESSFRPEIVWGVKRSPAGAVGIMQFMQNSHPDVIGNDPVFEISRAGKYIRELIDRFDADKRKAHPSPVVAAVAAYNWGRGNVLKKGLARAPVETKTYVQRILGVMV